MHELLAQAVAVWRSEQGQKLVTIFLWLGSVNGGFWILARASAALLHVFEEIVWEPLWAAVAVVYNLVLAATFSAVIAVSAVHGAPAADLLWRRGCGFVMLYLALSASYMDPRTHEIEDHARLGFVVGLMAYIVFAVAPELVARPALLDAIAMMKLLSDSWLGQLLTVSVIAGLAWRAVKHGLGELFQLLAPGLYMVGAIRHPAIRVRRRADD